MIYCVVLLFYCVDDRSWKVFVVFILQLLLLPLFLWGSLDVIGHLVHVHRDEIHQFGRESAHARRHDPREEAIVPRISHHRGTLVEVAEQHLVVFNVGAGVVVPVIVIVVVVVVEGGAAGSVAACPPPPSLSGGPDLLGRGGCGG